MIRSSVLGRRLPMLRTKATATTFNPRCISTSRQTPNQETPATAATTTTTTEWIDPNYVPGKQGYAPGFMSPRNKIPGEKPKRKTSVSDIKIPQPSPQQQEKLDKDTDPRRLFKQSMNKMRYQYMANAVKQAQDREASRERKLQEAVAKQRIAAAKERALRETYTRNVKNDPLSSYNVLNSDGISVMPNAEAASSGPKPSLKVNPKPEDIQVDAPLQPPRVSIKIDPEADAERKVQRAMNFEQKVLKDRQERMRLLMELYHEAGNFVTYENLEQKIHDFHIGYHHPSMQSIWDLTRSVEDSGGNISSREVSERVLKLKHALDGTVGRSSQNLGPESLEEWAKTKEKV